MIDIVLVGLARPSDEPQRAVLLPKEWRGPRPLAHDLVMHVLAQLVGLVLAEAAAGCGGTP